MKTNNIASYTDVLVTCMRQNPKWILLSEVRSAEAVMAVRNSISSGHYILSTIHADKAESIPNRMYSLLETNLDIDQFLKSVYRYIQLGVHIRGYQDKNTKRFVREVCEVCEFYVDEDNNPKSNVIYRKTATGQVHMKNPSKYLLDYLAGQGVILSPTIITGSEEEIDKQEDNNMASSIESAKATNVVANPMTDVAKPIVQPKSVVNTTQVVQPTVSTQPVQQAPVQNIVDTQTQSVQQSTPVNNIFKNTETLNI